MTQGADTLPRRLAPALFLMGFVATATQVLLLRRLMSVLYGNEMVVGVALAVWMAGTGLGSLIAATVSETRAKAFLAAVTAVCIALVPATIMGTYAIRAFLGIPPGQALAPGASILACVLLLVPLTALLGAMFVLFSVVDRGASEERVGMVYLLEALGAAAGGIASGLAASWGLPVFAWSFAVCAALLGIMWLVTSSWASWRPAGVALAAAFGLLVWGPGRLMPETARELAWPQQRMIDTVESRYGSLAITESGGQRTLFVNALPALTYPSRRQAETAVHTALLQHPNPRRVLLVGGGLSQAATEVFKHGVQTLDYVQIDPAINRLEREYLGGSGQWPSSGPAGDPFDDPRVRVHNVDGRLFVNEARGEPYDVVIVEVPDPATILINRFYTLEFFKKIHALLNPGGVFSFTCGEMENYVSGSLGRLLACEAATLEMSFGHYKMLPLGAVRFVASDSTAWLTGDGMALARRLEERGVQTAFMRDYYLGYDLSAQRVEYLSTEISKIRSAERTKVNMDRSPVAYFYYLTHWYRLLGSGLAAAMEAPWGRHARYWAPFAALAAFLLTALPGLRRRPGAARAVAVGAMGFATLTSQVVLLIALQTFRGQLYYSVGLVVAAFMVGMTLGALLERKRRRGTLAAPLALLAWYGAALAAAFFLPLERLPGDAFVVLAALTSLVGGLIGGAVFQRAAYSALESSASRSDSAGGVGVAAGILNAGDHLGAAAGAFAAASVLLPALGLSGTAAVAAACAGGSALGLALARL